MLHLSIPFTNTRTRLHQDTPQAHPLLDILTEHLRESYLGKQQTQGAEEQDGGPHASPAQGLRGPMAIASEQKHTTSTQQSCPSREFLAEMLMLPAKYITAVMLGTTDPEKTTK